jgi:hypothetical protein
MSMQSVYWSMSSAALLQPVKARPAAPSSMAADKVLSFFTETSSGLERLCSSD